MKLKYKTRRKYKKGGWFWFIDINDGKLKRTPRYLWITTFDGYMWSYDEKRWYNIYSDDRPKSGGSISHLNCRDVRSFRRQLRNWSKYLPKGVEFILIGRIVDFEVTGKTC